MMTNQCEGVNGYVMRSGICLINYVSQLTNLLMLSTFYTTIFA